MLCLAPPLYTGHIFQERGHHKCSGKSGACRRKWGRNLRRLLGRVSDAAGPPQPVGLGVGTAVVGVGLPALDTQLLAAGEIRKKIQYFHYQVRS